MNNEFEYYLIENAGVPSVPLLMNNDAMNPRGEGLITVYSSTYEKVDSPIYLSINPPCPAKPNFNVDFLQHPFSVYSQKIHDVLKPMNIKNYSLLPCIIADKRGEQHKDFWLEHIYNAIPCIDTEKSECRYISFGKTWGSFKKIVLKNELLKDIPPEERLIFRPAETSEFMLYHKSIVDAVMAVKPVNIKFIPVDEWYQGIQF
jgi:hypothetical protein